MLPDFPVPPNIIDGQEHTYGGRDYVFKNGVWELKPDPDAIFKNELPVDLDDSVDSDGARNVEYSFNIKDITKIEIH